MIGNVPAAGNAPTSALTMQGPGGVLGKDEFLKLLVTQLRHQDPLSPMKGEEMAVQLAQFTSVEQLINLNAAMKDQAALNAAMVDALNGNSALAAIGKHVVALGDQVVIPEEGDPGNVNFVIGGTGGAATLRIFNEGGAEVGSRELGFLGNGRHTASLEGTADDLPPGAYRYEIEVVDEKGERVSVQTFVTARVDGVRYGSSGPVLTAGPLEIPIGAIAEIVAGR